MITREPSGLARLRARDHLLFGKHGVFESEFGGYERSARSRAPGKSFALSAKNLATKACPGCTGSPVTPYVRGLFFRCPITPETLAADPDPHAAFPQAPPTETTRNDGGAFTQRLTRLASQAAEDSRPPHSSMRD